MVTVVPIVSLQFTNNYTRLIQSCTMYSGTQNNEPIYNRLR